MLRVTIELVPYGMESLAKTIAEVCIANVETDKETNVANYEVAGYENKYGKIEEFAGEVKSFERNQGALKLVTESLLASKSTIEEIKLGEKLLQHTRLVSMGEETTNEN